MSKEVKIISATSERTSLGMEVESDGILVENYAQHITLVFNLISPPEFITVNMGYE